METRKKWNKDEIEKIISLKNQGMKLFSIGLLFNKTANAVRKALTRHDPVYLAAQLDKSTPEFIDFSYSSNISYSDAMKWAKDRSMPVNVSKSTVTNIMIINKYRRENGYPMFCVRDF